LGSPVGKEIREEDSKCIQLFDQINLCVQNIIYKVMLFVCVRCIWLFIR